MRWLAVLAAFVGTGLCSVAIAASGDVVVVPTGRVRDRLRLPSMAEQLTHSGDRIVARCYDAKVVVVRLA